MKTILQQRLPVYVLLAALSMTLHAFSAEPSATFAKTDWNVRWQFQPGTDLVFDTVQEQTPYFERLRNSLVTGESDTTLKPVLEFVKSTNGIAFRLKTNGVTLTPTKSTTRIATIFSESEMVFRSVLRYDFNRERVRQTGSAISGNLVNRNIRVVLNTCGFPRIKMLLIMAGFEDSAKILRSRGLNKLQNQIHAKMIENLSELQAWTNGGFTDHPLGRLPMTRFRCRSDNLGAYGTFQLGTPSDKTACLPDAAEHLFEEYPLVFAAEQSVFNQVMQTRLGGITVPLHRLSEYLFSDPPAEAPAIAPETTTQENDVETDAADDADKGSPCYATLNKETPIELAVADGTLTFVIHVDKFEQSQKTYPAMDITVTYKIVSDDMVGNENVSDSPLFVRDGDVLVTAKNTSGEKTQPNLRQIAFRRWLLNFSNRDIPKRIDRDDLLFQEENPALLRIGQFRPVADSLVLDNGWIAVAYQLISDTAL